MKDQIRNNLNNPRELESMYRANKSGFTREFRELYPELGDHPAAAVWHERLAYSHSEISWGTTKELIVVIALAFIAGLIAKVPFFFGLREDFYFQRNLSFVVFPALIAYFTWKRQLPAARIIVSAAVIILSVLYINLLPANEKSDTLVLACIHLPVLLWSVLGYAFTKQPEDLRERIGFLRYNGDAVVMTTVILIAGGILSGVTIGLFELIGIKIEEFYFPKIAIWGLAAAPVIGTWLVQTNPMLVRNVSPVIARVFTPVVLVTLIIYLAAIIYTGKDPYNDREFLLIFNMLLAGVMAIILFSVAGTSGSPSSRINGLLLLLLSIVTIVVNGIALSAIVFRIFEWGITPNRIAVLGTNLLILTNLLLVSFRLLTTFKDGQSTEPVENSIASFLPVYTGWTIVVVFVFPVVFGFQ